MLPELKIHTTNEDVRYILFEQKEVISDVVRETGYFNKDCFDIADNILLKSNPGANVLDIGSGIGTFTIPLAIKHANGFSFHAFEPIPVISSQLSANILLNNLENVRAYNTGIANFDGLTDGPILDVHHCENHGSVSFFRAVNDARGVFSPQNSMVYDFRKLDSFNFKGVALIKITVNGMETEVINGAKETINKNNNPPIIIQLWSNDFNIENKEQTLTLLQSLGYRHFCNYGEHYLCCVSDLEYEYLTTPDPSTADFGELSVTEEIHDADESLSTQQPLK